MVWKVSPQGSSATAFPFSGSGFVSPIEDSDTAFRVAVDPAGNQQIANLQTVIADFAIHEGTKNSLLAKLRAASDSLSRGNTNAACNQLKALSRAQSGKNLSVEQANAIIAALETLQTDLGCT